MGGVIFRYDLPHLRPIFLIFGAQQYFSFWSCWTFWLCASWYIDWMEMSFIKKKNIYHIVKAQYTRKIEGSPNSKRREKHFVTDLVDPLEMNRPLLLDLHSVHKQSTAIMSTVSGNATSSDGTCAWNHPIHDSMKVASSIPAANCQVLDPLTSAQLVK